jgi:hypothetical protein
MLYFAISLLGNFLFRHLKDWPTSVHERPCCETTTYTISELGFLGKQVRAYPKKGADPLEASRFSNLFTRLAREGQTPFGDKLLMPRPPVDR